MGQAVTNIRDMMRLVASLRQSAAEASLESYRERLLRAAAEVEAQARWKAEHLDDPDFDSERDAALHQPVDLII
jgi:DNA invertase Pin-like site-specific DNA recombinase